MQQLQGKGRRSKQGAIDKYDKYDDEYIEARKHVPCHSGNCLLRHIGVLVVSRTLLYLTLPEA